MNSDNRSVINSQLIVYFLSLHVGLALLDQSLALTFCLGLELIAAAHSCIADPTAAPASADYREKRETGLVDTG